MKTTGKKRLGPGLWLAAWLFLLAGCSETAPSIMDPKGPAARSIADLGWVFFILGTVIFIAVMIYLGYALLARRPGAASARGGTMIVIIAGMIVPGLILLVLFVLNTNALGQVTAPQEDEAAVVIEVNGRQWWWEITYQDPEFETANEIHIPVGQPVLLRLTAEDVIHSFWVPELHGKMDLIPGRVNNFWIQADEPGVYLGECAEYCGLQHAKMQFLVVAESQEEYEQWVQRNTEEAELTAAGNAQQGQEIFLNANCVQCHAVRGSEAAGDLGPDLTHLASRRTIGAGSLEMNRGNLLGWVANPHSIKEGVKMPPADISGDDLQVLIDFLLTLE